MKTLPIILLSLFSTLALPFTASAATCDQYPGDVWIYGGITSSVQPNVLIIVDTSGSMADSIPAAASAYDPSTTYTAANACRDSRNNTVSCSSSRIYKSANRGRWTDAGFNLSAVSTSCNSKNPHDLLATTGQYTGRTLSSSGACASRGNSSYATGNWINWDQGSNAMVPKITVARDVVKSLVTNTSGVNMGVMVYNGDNGSRFFNSTVSGSTYTTTVKNLDDTFSGSLTNRDALLSSINTTTVVASGGTPLAESLYEAGQYFKGGTSAFSNTIGLSGSPSKYTTPITSSCQKNYIVFITDGMATSDNSSVLTSPVCTQSDKNNCMPDVATYLYNNDLLTDDATAGKEYTIGKQNISTFTIGFGTVGADATAVALLQQTADNGHGTYYLAENQSGLSSALTQIISSILSIDSSFVAPVVPVSPDNRTYSSNRVYLGFFKPVDQLYWEGNLKKYGLDANNNIIDSNGQPLNWTDANGDRIDDITGERLPTTASNGSFRTDATSYWSSTADAGSVNSGGAGDMLLQRTTSSRELYTYTGSNSSLTHSSNSFSTTNSAITATTLGVASSSAKNTLIDFVYGIDVYDENANGNRTEKRAWLLGDILHSKPLVVHYASYTVNDANESDCDINQSVIYVGSNDGMLHAINDCDGSEAWAFIPPEVLPNLKEIPLTTHSYAVDASPAAYVYNADNSGNISTSTDKVIMMVGLRRGGGPNSSPTKGSYYALDVTDPANPVYLWSLSNTTSNFSELGESWGEPKIVKLKIGTATKVAAFIPGGYDNMNEDSRYGATQTYTGTGTVSNSTSGAGTLTSTGTSAPSSPKGRGIFAVELATLSSAGVPTVASSPTRIWGAVYGSSTSYSAAPATDSGMTFPIVNDITTLDTDGNGYIDRVYAADLGGNLWRFDVGATSIASWTGKKIFSANPASGSDTGRKIFYKPAVTLEAATTDTTRGSDALIFMGSGDREHPTNTAVLDRMYAVRDKGQTTTKYESDLVDVTTDQLQAATGSQATIDAAVNAVLTSLSSATKYGWYIQLNQNSGEKVLAPPAINNRIAYFTTFTPGSSVNVDPCSPSNMGTSRLYVLNYATGEAVMNYDTTNDSTTTANKRAQAKPGGEVLLRSDRVKSLGSGIASGVIIVRDKAFIGCGGGICTEAVKSGSSGRIINLYWMQK